MRLHRATLSGIGFATAIAAMACTYDFDRFADATPASSAGAPSAGSSGSASGGSAGKHAAGGKGGESGESGGQALGGQAGDPATGAGGGAGFSCDELGGAVHDEHCYFAIAPGSGLLWASARETCESFSPSSHLATITSHAEQAAIEDAFSPSVTDYWIGLSLADVEDEPSDDCDEAPESCPFEWVTGDKLIYTNWAEHSESDEEPNYTGACVRLQLDGFAWADFDCGTRLPALCEHDGRGR